MADICLTLICPPEVEEHILDLLLLEPGIAVFTSTSTSAHGVALGARSQMEQVLGRASALQIQALISETDKLRIIAAISGRFAGAGIRYWVSQIAESGEVQ